MIIDWSIKEIQNQIFRILWAANDPRQDGFTTWRCKQDLYQVKFMVDQALAKCSTYAGETEWLEQQRKEQEKQQIWHALNQKN